MTAEFFTLLAGDLSDCAQGLREFMGSREQGIAVIDLRQYGPQHPPACDGIADVRSWERALRLLERSPAATVALFGSQVSGGALEVGLACDFRIAEPATRLIWRNNNGAIWPSTGLFRLVQLVGAAQTRRLALLGEQVPADAALACGLVDMVSDEPCSQLDKLRAAVDRLHDMRVVRQLITEATHTGYDEAVGAHLAACDRYLRQRHD